jgi:connector enhancer of kinase suppressor of Ras 2
MCNVEDTIIETFSPIPFVDEEQNVNQNPTTESSIKTEVANNDTNFNTMKTTNINQNLVEAINTVLVEKKKTVPGFKIKKLDKSHSAPTYDDNSDDMNGESYKCITMEFRQLT